MMRRATQKSQARQGLLGARWLAMAFLCHAVVAAVYAQEPPVRATVALEAYQTAKARIEKSPDNAETAWQFGRACFDWAEFSTNDTHRATIAREGITACERALNDDPDLAAAHYYLGMNQGQLARTMNLGALNLVQKMEEHFLKAKRIDPKFDEAGPDRNLGLLYLEAPGWPLSLGNRFKARNHLRKAVELAPRFPENRLNLMEAYERWHDTAAVKREIEAWKKNLQSARKSFSGDRWHWDWLIWDQRFEALKERLAKPVPVLRSPKAKG